METIQYFFWVFYVISIGCFGAIFTDKEYYEKLIKPSIAPRPMWYGIIWTVLYILQIICCQLYQRNHTDGKWDTTLILYIVFSAVSGLFTLFFFYFNALILSTVIMIASTVLVIITDAFFFKNYPESGWLFLPTVIWVIIATYIMIDVLINNYSHNILFDNDDSSKRKKDDDINNPQCLIDQSQLQRYYPHQFQINSSTIFTP